MQPFCRFRSALTSAVLISGLLAASACGRPPPHADLAAHADPHLRQPIVHGRQTAATDIFDPVVMLHFTAQNTACSGTLIAPDTVLTAAHCVPPEWHVQGGVRRLAPSQRLDVLFHRGPSRVLTREAAAVAIHDHYRGLFRCAHPAADAQKACETWGRRCGALSDDAQPACLSSLDPEVRRALGVSRLWPTHDVALVFLQAPVTEIAPAKIIDDRCCSNLVHPRAPVLIAGYGQQKDTRDDPGAIGAIHHGHNHIVEVGPGEFRIDGGSRTHPCFGDSGGPVFAEIDHDGEAQRIQVGVASRIWDYHHSRGCASGLAYTRIDQEAGFIGSSLRDAVIEGVRRPENATHDPHMEPRGPHVAHAAPSCREGSASWGVALLVVLWLAARRGMDRGAGVA